MVNGWRQQFLAHLGEASLDLGTTSLDQGVA